MIGRTVSHYEILEKLGEGGMGVVYKARDTRLDRIVALKFLPERLNASEADKARFVQEAKAAANLNHPNVCTVYRIDEHDGQQFIEMEYVDGETLRRKIPQRKTDEALAYAVQIGEALQEAHAKGIVHRDIKAENIMVNAKNQIKVMDFGLAKVKGSLMLTKASSTVGTLGYMAPEQIQGGDVDARSDIFSFGVVLFEMLSGKLPFRGEHDAAMMYSIVNEPPDSVLKYRPDLSPEIDRIIARAIEKDPEDRYQSAADMVSELRRIQKQTARVSRTMIAALPAPSQAAAAAPDTAPPQPAKPPGFRKWWIVAAAIALLSAGGFFSYKYFFTGASALDSLAVLPLVNASADPSIEYLSDGITESIINSMTRIRELRVIPRSTVFRFKGNDADPQDVGTKLNVKAVLAGRMIQHGDELEIQVDLIDVRHQSQIWGDRFQRKLTDVFSLQEEIVGKVSRELKLTLTGETERAVNKRFTASPEAYKLYLQGTYFLGKRRGPELLKAEEFFRQAIETDPDYALAYVGSADCYLIMPQYAGLFPREIYPKAEAAARKALELDNSLGEAHNDLAFLKQNDFDWKGAEVEYQTAISLTPNYPTVYHWYSIFLGRLGRYDEAYAAIQKAADLDPLSPVILLNVAIQKYRVKHDLPGALAGFQKVIDLDAGFGAAYAQRGYALCMEGKLNEALPDLEKGVELSVRSAENLASLSYCLAKLGRTAEARKILDELLGNYAKGNGSAYHIAKVYLGLGETDKAFEWLNRDLVDRSGWVSNLTFDPVWEHYLNDPRAVAIFTKMNWPKVPDNAKQ
ncbi:MAG TPA: protein kinase [Bacteroidota bacterium]|nr:protein kinase [Bacteroidota bacterium]